jgi:hypothetical protein
MSVAGFAGLCALVLLALLRRPRTTVCLLATLSAAHAAGLVATPAPVRHVNAGLARWQDRQADRITCRRLLVEAVDEQEIRAAELACRRAG